METRTTFPRESRQSSEKCESAIRKLARIKLSLSPNFLCIFTEFDKWETDIFSPIHLHSKSSYKWSLEHIHSLCRFFHTISYAWCMCLYTIIHINMLLKTRINICSKLFENWMAINSLITKSVHANRKSYLIANLKL